MTNKLARLALGLAVAAGLAVSAQAQDLTTGLMGNVTSIDPHFHNLGPNNSIANQIFEGLIEQDERQRLKPSLATEWKAIDPTTWEFKLRRGVKFHDGSDFSAEDVVASFKRIPWVPNSPSSYVSFVRPITETIVVDPFTIRFKTAAPYPLLPNDMANVSIVSKKFEQAPTGDFNAGRAAIGTGPYRFAEFVPGDRIVLQRFDGHWGVKGHWAKVTHKIITNDAARVAALLAGDVQIIENVPTPDLARVRQNANLSLSQTLSNRLIYLHVDSFRDQSPFVTDKAGAVLPNNPLKDRRVRQALSKAINRPAIVERVMDGAAIPAGDIIPEGMFGSNPKNKAETFDPEAARKLLAEAGYPNGFGMTIHGPNDRYLNDEKILQAVGPMFTRIGIDTKVVTSPWATFSSQSSAPNYAFSLVLVGWGAGTGESAGNLRALLATVDRDRGMGASNRGRYSNPQVDTILREALATVDDEKREKLLQDASEIAMREAGLIPLHYQVNIWGMRKGLAYTARTDEYTLAQYIRPAN